MPTTVTYPGVYIEEVPSGVRTIVGVATSITAFVGLAERGPTNEPVRIQSFADFQRRFGGLQTGSMLGYAVSHFFANGGTDAIVVRVAATDAKTAKLTLPGPAGNLTLEAKGEGKWGNGLQATVSHATSDPTNDTLFNLTVTDTYGDVDATNNVVEVFRNVSVDKTHPSFLTNILEDESMFVRVSGNILDDAKWPREHPLPAPGKFDDGFDGDFYTQAVGGADDGTPVKAKVTLPGGLILEAKDAGVAGNAIRVRVEHDPSDDKLYSLLVKNGAAAEEKFDVSTDTTAMNFVKLVLATKVVEAADPVPASRPHKHAEPKAREVTKAAGGDDGSTPTDQNDSTILIGDSAKESGLEALRKVDLFNLLCIPPLERGGTTHADAYKKGLEICGMKRAMLLVDAPAEWDTVSAASTKVGALRASLDPKFTKNAAVFFPRVKMGDPLRRNRTDTFVPSGAIAGVIANTDARRGVWKAPAGIEAGIGGVREYTVKMNDPENGILNPLGVNCLRNFPVYGNVVWGSRTLDGADQLTSEWKYLSVRRLTLFLEESLYRGTQWVVFEPNDEPLWAQIRQNVGAFMQGLFRKGAFQGQSAKEAYFVKCDGTTTTQNDVNLGIVNIEVGFAPLKPAEFVVIKIQQIAGDIDT